MTTIYAEGLQLVQHLKAPHSPNGNPQRLYLVTTFAERVYNGMRRDTVTMAYNEGFSGDQAIPPIPPGGMRRELPSCNITRSEYHRLLKQYPPA